MTNDQPVTVVTDSTTDIPDELVEELGIEIVPLRVNFGQESFQDRIELNTEQLMQRIADAPALPTTSQPTPGEFAAVFQDTISAGRDVVCVTLGSKLSGTYQAAVSASDQVDSDRVTVIDGGGTSMQVGWPAVAGARAAKNGGDHETVAQAIRDGLDRSNMFVVLKTLDHVYKGGRIGRAQNLVGSALGIKPILSFREGTLVPLERIRTWKKAVRRTVELVKEEGDLSDIMVMYTDVPDDAQKMRDELQNAYPEANILFGPVGAVIATHAGPGAVGIGTLRRS